MRTCFGELTSLRMHISASFFPVPSVISKGLRLDTPEMLYRPHKPPSHDHTTTIICNTMKNTCSSTRSTSETPCVDVCAFAVAKAAPNGDRTSHNINRDTSTRGRLVCHLIRCEIDSAHCINQCRLGKLLPICAEPDCVQRRYCRRSLRYCTRYARSPVSRLYSISNRSGFIN